MALKDPRTGLGWVERGTDYVTTYSLFDTPAHLVAIQTLQGNLAAGSTRPAGTGCSNYTMPQSDGLVQSFPRRVPKPAETIGAANIWIMAG